MTSLPSKPHPYSSFLHRVEKPARYVGGEYHSVRKEGARVRMCLAFPDVYDIGMSHLGTKILYKTLNADPELALERVYTPWFDMEAELRANGLPLLSLESALPLSAFDVVGFSLQYEMTYTNLLTMLELGGIPLRGEERTLSDPLVVAGGPCATHPEPLAPFVDAFLVGDGEEALPRLLRAFADLRDGGASRLEMLLGLARLPGVYVPALYDTEVDERSGLLVVGRPLHPDVPAVVERALLEDLNRFPFPIDTPEPVAEAIFDRVSVEIARGCTEGCRFCQAGMIYRPVRERDPEQVVEAIVGAMAQGGYDEASLTSLSTADYSCISPLIKRVMERLRPRNASLSVSSLRAYGLDEELLDEMASVRATGLTFAPEAGTQRMRDVVNKNITEDDILTTCHRVFARGWKRVKLYFMIGLPTEEPADVLGIAEMGRQALDVGRQYHRRVDVAVSVSSHVPKPHTPFQWCAMDATETLEAKQALLFEQARRLGFTFRRHDVKVSYLEGIVTRGDRRTGDLIELAWRKGARFDGWDEHLKWDAWQEALAEWEAHHGVTREQFLATLPLDGRLPWDHIDVGLAEGFLAKEYKKAVAGRLSPPCGKPAGAKVHHTNLADAEADERRLVCYHCGIACDMTHMREERRTFLVELGALEPTRHEEGATTERDRAHERFRRGLTPRVMAHGARARYRLRYTKLGPVALFGHLDMVRKVPRVFVRGGVELCYSEGFHPKPILQFTPALALGISSVAEYLDVLVVDPLEPEVLLARLNEASPEGLCWLGAAHVPDDEPKLSKILSAQDYLLTVSDDWLAERFGAGNEQPALEALCADVLAHDRLEVVRPVKGRARPEHRDIRPLLRDLRVLSSQQWPEVLPLENRWGVRVRLPLENGPSVRPVELGRALFGAELSHADIARLAIWADVGAGLTEPLALASPRQPALAEAPEALAEAADVSRETSASQPL
jgi:radical SAM family uncharacterized protein/radical SAM-linked protein